MENSGEDFGGGSGILIDQCYSRHANQIALAGVAWNDFFFAALHLHLHDDLVVDEVRQHLPRRIKEPTWIASHVEDKCSSVLALELGQRALKLLARWFGKRVDRNQADARSRQYSAGNGGRDDGSAAHLNANRLGS